MTYYICKTSNFLFDYGVFLITLRLQSSTTIVRNRTNNMKEHLIVKSFGPVKDLDITFNKVTVFIGDQGTGKSCIAKLFSICKWLEKELMLQRKKTTYYEQYNRFRTQLCTYHRIESFFNDETYICFEGTNYTFTYEASSFQIQKNEKRNNIVPKIMYVPAERSILSVAENKSKLMKELPDSCDAFFDEFSEAKRVFKSGYDLPFGNLHYEYDQLNDTSRITGNDYIDKPVKLSNASSGIQAALPLCIVSEYLSDKVALQEETKQSKEERDRLEKQVAEIMNNDGYTESVKGMMLKQLSSLNRYGCFINIAEEPELNLFPKSQMGVLSSLIAANAKTDENMLIITTHSPYSLSILNLLLLASKVYDAASDEKIKTEVNEIVDRRFHISDDDLAAYNLSQENGDKYCRSIINEVTGLISKNDLDTLSGEITHKFNNLYRIYATVSK